MIVEGFSSHGKLKIPRIVADGDGVDYYTSPNAVDVNRSSPPTGVLLGYVAYQQVASITGVFALIAFVSHFVPTTWCGAIGDGVNAWNESVRPAVKFVLDNSVVALANWLLASKVDVPLVARDYLAVGVVNYMSDLRALNWYFAGRKSSHEAKGLLDIPGARHIRILLLDVFAWPMTLLRDIVRLVSGQSRTGAPLAWQGWFAGLLSILPLMYFGAVVLANSIIYRC